MQVLIIGSGFAGLCMAIHLRRAGNDSFLILEKSSEAGGTWLVNTYPGCACDIPSHLYSYSFACSPEWSRMYPTQAEIWHYMLACVDRYGLRPFIRFNSEVSEASFDEVESNWHVRTAHGDRYIARTLVAGMGGLSRPAYPSIPGLDRFQGPAFHSAAWDHAYDLRDKRVAVIGTGASAIQFVPQIAPRVARLHLFQRSPPWILPKFDRPIRPWERAIYRRVPAAMRLFRWLLYWRQELLAAGFTVNPAYLKPVEKLARRHIAAGIADPGLRRKVTPNYTPGCKRLLIANDYYPALERPNVELVTSAIAEIRERAVLTQDGAERPVDALIFATGFRATGLLTPLRVLGRGGVDLNDAWREGLEAYYGITVTGFPNFFLLVGPNTGLGHNSIIFMIEAQVHYVMQCLRLMDRRQAASLEVRPEVQAYFNRDLQRRMARTVWATGCKSWYQDERGKNTTLWPGSTWSYWLQTRHVVRSDYLLKPR